MKRTCDFKKNLNNTMFCKNDVSEQKVLRRNIILIKKKNKSSASKTKFITQTKPIIPSLMNRLKLIYNLREAKFPINYTN